MTHESGTLHSDEVRGMFDRIAPVYDAMNRVMTAGLDRSWRRLAVEAVVQPGDRVLDACCGTGDLAVAAEREGGVVTGLDFSPGMLERARRKSDTVTWVEGDLLALPFDDDAFDAATVGFGVRNVADLEAALGELRRVLRPGGRLAILEITQPRGVLKPFFSLWFDRIVPLLGKVLPGREGLHVPARQRAALPRRRGARRADGAAGVRAGQVPPVGRIDRRAARRGRRVSALETVRSAVGLSDYLDAVEARLAEVVEAHPGTVASVGADALAAGGKRLRPTLTFLSSSPDAEPPVIEGVAVELVHMATLVARRHRRRRAAPPWPRRRVDGARRLRREGDRRPSVRGGVRDAGRHRVAGARRGARGRLARAGARRGAAAAAASRRVDDRRVVPRSGAR